MNTKRMLILFLISGIYTCFAQSDETFAKLKEAEKRLKEATAEYEAKKNDFTVKIKQYKYIKHPKENFRNHPASKLNMQNFLEDLSDNILKGRDKTRDKFSFQKYYTRGIMNMEAKKIPRVFEVLNGFIRVAQICSNSKITSLDKVTRPVELDFVYDKNLGIKTYTYVIHITAEVEGRTKFLLNLANDKKYFYLIKSVVIEGDKAEIRLDWILPIKV